MSAGVFFTTCLAYRAASSKGKNTVVRLLYGKRRNLPHQHSTSKPGVIDTLLTSSSSSLALSGNPSSLSHLRTPCTTFIYGLQRAFTLGELGRGEVLSILQKNRKLKRLEYSRALWEWCTTPMAPSPQEKKGKEKDEKVGERNEEAGETMHPCRSSDLRKSLASSAVQNPTATPVLPPQASLWTAAHDVVFISHINDTGGTGSHLVAGSWEGKPQSEKEEGERPHSFRAPITVPCLSSFLSSLSLVQQVYQRAMYNGHGNHRALLGGLLTAYAKEGDWRGSLRAYQKHIIEDGKLSDSFHLHIVMNACRRCGAWEEGIKLFQRAVGGICPKRNSLVKQKEERKKKNKGEEIEEVEGVPMNKPSVLVAASPSLAIAPIVPTPNAVVYLELLRLFSQSGLPQRYRTARAVLEALHSHSRQHVEEEEEEEEQDGNHSEHRLPSPREGGASSVKGEGTPQSQSNAAGVMASSTDVLPVDFASSSFSPLPPSRERRRHIPITLTAGHYNAVLGSLKPTHEAEDSFGSKSGRGIRPWYVPLLQPCSSHRPSGRTLLTERRSGRHKKKEEEVESDTNHLPVKEERKKRSEVASDPYPLSRHRSHRPLSSASISVEQASDNDWMLLLQHPAMTMSSSENRAQWDALLQDRTAKTEGVVDRGEKKTSPRRQDGSLVPFFLCPPYAPPHLREGWRLYYTMKQRNIQPSKETLPTLLSLHPRHLLHVLCCIAECHRLALPVTADMYRAALMCFTAPSYMAYVAHQVQQSIEQGCPPEKVVERLLDPIRFIEAEYHRYEALEVKEEGTAKANQRRATKQNEEEHLLEEWRQHEEVDESGHETPSTSFVYTASPDMLGLHLSTALVDVLLAHPRPREAQYWLSLFAPRLSPLLAALSYGVCDRLGIESTADLFSVVSGTSTPAPPSSSSFFWQVEGRVAVVDHNVLLSPLFESLFFHYDAVFVPFSALRVLVRRLKELRANSKQAKYTRRALRMLRERVTSFASASSSSSSSVLPLYVLPLAHQLYAHRYLEGLYPSSSSSSSSVSPEEENMETTSLPRQEVPPHMPPPPSPSPAPPTLSEKLLQALQDTSSPISLATPLPSSESTLVRPVPSSTAPSISSPPSRQHAMESSPHGAGFRQAAEEGAPLSPTSSPRHRQSEVALSTKEKDGCHIPVKVRFGLHRPHYSITMPERVLAVACMLKTLNSEASVHVLSSSSGSPSSSHKRFTCGKPSRSGFHPKPTLLAEEEKQSAGVGRRTNSQGHPSGGGGRKGRAKQEKSLDRHTSPPAQSFPTPCALEEAVNRWNAFQSKKIAAESLSSRKEKKKLKDPHDEQIGEQEEDVPLTMRGLRLTHVYHPTELAEKAPSELQLPSSSMQ